MFETFDHTADLGLRIVAADLDTLFAEAATALFSVIIENPDAVVPGDPETITIRGKDKDFLLFDWLRELLYRFDADHRVYCEFSVHVDAEGLKATVRGELLDPSRHQLGHEVKAITYHELKVEQTADGWCAELIVDI